MATTTPARDTQHTVALDLIRVPDKVRDLDPEHVHAFAGSIALQGVLVPGAPRLNARDCSQR
jgi:hypothetical protein